MFDDFETGANRADPDNTGSVSGRERGVPLEKAVRLTLTCGFGEEVEQAS
jgi:hypothetical protein